MNHELLARIESALTGVDPRDAVREDTLPVWQLSEPGMLAFSGRARREAIEQCKRRLLSLFASSGSGYLQHPDDPADCEAKGPWVRGESKTTPLPTALDLDDPGTQHWLFALGNWQAYVAPYPIHQTWPDPARIKSDDLLAWMSQVGILALIDSFHDDVSWVIAVSDRLAA